jgi:hypothetical protein
MMRDDLVERAADALREAAAADEITYAGDARRVLDAVLPILATAEELDALPVTARVLAADGKVWRKINTAAWVSDVSDLRRSAGWLVRLRQYAPLTLVWQR